MEVPPLPPQILLIIVQYAHKEFATIFMLSSCRYVPQECFCWRPEPPWLWHENGTNRHLVSGYTWHRLCTACDYYQWRGKCADQTIRDRATAFMLRMAHNLEFLDL